jgi:phospholipid/cholesterol/gamma-HCH transport system permease protein
MNITLQTAAVEATPDPTLSRHRRIRGGLKNATKGAVNALQQAGEMTELLLRVVKSAVMHPRGYWADVREQMYEILRMCWLPMIVSTTAFGFGAPGLQGGNIFLLFGIPERLGSFFLMASVREFAPWINAMVVAGVMGTAITADLGARRIREEFDAMEVLGVDPIRTVILPRVLALTIMTGLLDVVALSFGVVGGLCATIELNANSSAYFANFWNNATTTDMWGSVSKTFLFGLIIGVVCCYKGYKAEGGPIGVGRAVNQAVVIAFAAIWAFNWSFTQIMLGLNPSMQVYR